MFKKRLILKRSVIYTLCVTVLVIGLIISMTTKKGIIYSGVKNVLDGLGIYTEELRDTSIESPNYSNPGSFKIDKSFEWVDYKKIKVTYDLTSKIKTGDKYKDVILVLDVSGSMEGDKLTKAKEDIKELINYLLEDEHNHIALITFETTSNILSDFTNDKETLLQMVDNIQVAGCTNYYAALSNVYSIMSNYTKNNDTDVVTVFMTDGYPNEDTPSEKVMYQALKQNYPYMDINGIEFEMGNKIIPEVDNVTDNIWITNRDNLQNALFEAAVNPDNYETFTIDDYISNYFTTTDNDIKVDRGEATLNNNTINWNLGENLRAGSKAKMEVVLTIKDEYMESQNYYPLSTKDIINYSLNNNSNTINNTNNLVTKNIYDVKYDVNAPDGCSLSSISKEESAAFTNVTKNQNKLNCGGYLFKGFEIRDLDSSDIQYMNDDVFVMPGHDVEIKGVWSKQSVYKSMDGTIKESATLYNVLKQQEGTLTLKYEGEHHDSFDREPTHDIYHYYAEDTTAGNQVANTILDSNNVVFGGYCWQMIRTTDTGGVKMIYNGPPDETIVDGKTKYSCSSSRATTGYEGYSTYNSQSLGSTAYYYGSDYTYDRSTKKFTLLNERNDIKWTTNKDEILSNYPYTCKKTTANTLCDSVYYIESEDTRSGYQDYANTITINASSHYSQYGVIPFNTKYKSPADVGYMYNKRYEAQQKVYKDNGFLYAGTMRETSTYSYYYSSTISYNSSTGKYELGSDKVQIPWVTYKSSSLDSQKRYTCRSTSATGTCSAVYYVVDVTTVNNKMLARIISGGYEPTNQDEGIVMSKGIVDNNDGTISLDEDTKTEISRMDWYSNYNSYKNYYYCSDYQSSTCNKEDMRYITKSVQTITSNTDGVYYLPMSEIKFSSSFKYENGEYTLDGTIYDIWNYDSSTEKGKIANAHYTCFNDTGVCQDINYVYYYDKNNCILYHVSLNNGVNIGQAKDEMLYADEVNTYDSTIKLGIDMWYKRYLSDYSEYLEETIFCNDRSISDLGGWKPDGGSITSYLQFKNSSKVTDLSCSKETDRFSISGNNTKAKLKYSVGLLSAPEAYLLNNNNIRKTNKAYWLVSSHSFNDNYYFGNIAVGVRFVDSYGNNNDVNSSGAYGVRPSVSLAPDTEYSEGDGSMESPYVINVGE